ncbi:expansin EXLX1 family cellulose-binding protein [Streptomyces xanthophaeus]|uniref:expansin EXLX1 family cellulose-binding protein n=1 Tax=Streptomyces xanthophaeus TaxID=67385 RepID=UPI0038644E16|nr:expansin EXLX1 family cellulose-binding protein [Streptomyces xanthophaeus]WST59227.1 expansin EXLX1 family cellulose-binding protein [Streptomyces xanthophaeus]
MQTARQAARQRRRRHRLMLGTAVILTAAGVLFCLVTAMLPDPKAGAGAGAGADVAAPAATRTGAASSAPTSPAPPAAGSPTAATPSATAAATTAAAAPPPAAKKTPPAASTPAPSAGRIRPGTTYKGVATAYAAADGNGACLFGPSDDLMIAAMNTTDYESSKACGAYVHVRAANGASITVRITNECPLPCAPGQLDLSEQAFAKLAELKVGRIPITWSLVSPRTSDTLSLRYKTGSSAHWCGIQVIDHRNPVARLEVRTSKGWRKLPRTDYNYFLSADGGGCGGAIRITDIYGEQLTVDGTALLPNVAQPTRVQFAAH